MFILFPVCPVKQSVCSFISFTLYRRTFPLSMRGPLMLRPYFETSFFRGKIHRVFPVFRKTTNVVFNSKRRFILYPRIFRSSRNDKSKRFVMYDFFKNTYVTYRFLSAIVLFSRYVQMRISKRDKERIILIKALRPTGRGSDQLHLLQCCNRYDVIPRTNRNVFEYLFFYDIIIFIFE